MSEKFTVIIPARFASTRLPGKMLRDIAGKSMIQRVYDQACKSDAYRVVIATDHAEIFDRVKTFTNDVLLTKESHPSGTDRLQEAAQLLKLQGDDIVVNVQGDEPLIPPAVINQVANNIQQNLWASVSTLSVAITDEEEYLNPNAVKVVSDHQGRALYFSRAPIPFYREGIKGYQWTGEQSLKLINRHVGIYAYRVNVLNDFVQWPMAPLENIEKLEQLRVMVNGKAIHVGSACETVPAGVDTESDLLAVQRWFESNNC